MKQRLATAASRRRSVKHRWADYDDERLLDLRFCDLRLSIKRTPVAAQIERLYGELAARGLRFKPHVWLADEWFSPDGVPGFAVPFYLAHPRLASLERKMMQEVEGGNANWMLRILRHETGHAIDTAYRIRRRKDWREIFGKASRPYPRTYRPQPTSKKFVLHLGHWYAQTHPTEDFAETFAVWLQPHSRWRRTYAGWPALAKLNYVDALMQEIKLEPPKVRSREIIEPLSENTRTLRDYYNRELARYDVDTTRAYDRLLTRVFVARTLRPDADSATVLLRALRAKLTRALTRDARVHAYLVHNVMRIVIERCRELDLGVRHSATRDREAVARLVEHIVFDTLYRRRQRYAL